MTIRNKTDGHCTVNVSEKSKTAERKAMARPCFINKCNTVRHIKQNNAMMRG